MGAQLIKHINWDDLTTSGWKHPFPKQSNFKTFEEIWRFILLIRSLFRRWAGRQNLKVVVWDAQEKVGCGKRAWPIRGMYGIINRGGRNFSIITSKTWFYKLPATRFSPKNWIFLVKSFENFQNKPFNNIQNSKIFEKRGKF